MPRRKKHKPRPKPPYILLGSILTGAAILLFFTTLLPEKDYATLDPFKPLTQPANNNQNATATRPDIISVFADEETSHIKVAASCDAFFNGACLNVRSGPGTEYPVVKQLRNGTVLAVADKVREGTSTSTWYKVAIDEYLHYPERVTTDWYVSGELVVPFMSTSTANSNGHKEIFVDISEQLLTAKENNRVVQQIRISTGLVDNPTPIGDFTVLRKTPSRYMQGPLQNGVRDPAQTMAVSEHDPEYYDLPGVPWNLYFTHDGAVVHGAYWHVNFGYPNSHGCINVPPQNAEALYNWADVGTKVYVSA